MTKFLLWAIGCFSFIIVNLIAAFASPAGFAQALFGWMTFGTYVFWVVTALLGLPLDYWDD